MDDEIRNTDVSQNTSEASLDNVDVDGLYARVNLEGLCYRDFSESREQARMLSRRSRELTSRKSSETPTLPSATSPISKTKLSPRKARAIPLAARKTPYTPNESKRWAALKNVIAAPDTLEAKSPRSRIPVNASALVLCSFAGGVGKTMLAATLGRALALLGERVLLVETQSYNLLPFYLGAQETGTDDSPRTFYCGESCPPLTLMTATGLEHARMEGLAERIAEQAKGQDHLLIDAATGSRELQDILRIPATVLVVLTPDMASVVSLEPIRQFFEELREELFELSEPCFILNQFDPSLRLHLDIRNALSAQLGKRLLPFSLHRSSAVREALAEGMTVQQYAPSSQTVNDLERLTHWLRELHQNAAQEAQAPFRRERSCN